MRSYLPAPCCDNQPANAYQAIFECRKKHIPFAVVNRVLTAWWLALMIFHTASALGGQLLTCKCKHVYTACDTNGRVHGTNHINIRNIQHVLNLLEWKHEHCTKYVWHICQYNLLIPRRLEKLFRQEFPRNVVASRPKKVTTPSGSWRDSRLVIYWEAASWSDHWDGWATIKQCWENNSALKSWQFSSTKTDIER